MGLPYRACRQQALRRLEKEHPGKNERKDILSSLNAVIVFVIGIGVTSFLASHNHKGNFCSVFLYSISNRAFLAEDFGIECWAESDSIKYGDTDNMIHAVFV